MFTEVTAVSGTLYGVIIVAATSFLSIYIFTANLRLAVLCIALVLCILTMCLAFFQWNGALLD